MVGYSADLEGILKGSKHIAAAFEGSKKMLPQFEATCQEFHGWWGEEGEGDDFADKLGESYRGKRESVADAVRGFTEAIDGLINAVAEQADLVGRPQQHALEDIENSRSESETRR